MNQKTVVFSVIALVLVVTIFLIFNPEQAEEINIPIIDQPDQTTENQSETAGGGGGGGGFGRFFRATTTISGGVGGGGGGGSGGNATTSIAGTTTSIIIGGNTTTTSVIGSNTTSTTVVGGTSTTTTSTTTSTSTSVAGSSTTSTTIPPGSTTSTSTVQGCPNNFVIDYDLDCKGTTGNFDDELFVKITNNEPNGYTFDVYVDNNIEGSTTAAGFGSFGLLYSGQITNWWRLQSSPTGRTFNVRIEYLTSCSMTDSVTVVYPPSSSECVD